MIADLKNQRKVRCHKEAVENASTRFATGVRLDDDGVENSQRPVCPALFPRQPKNSESTLRHNGHESTRRINIGVISEWRQQLLLPIPFKTRFSTSSVNHTNDLSIRNIAIG
jgi:hypothetical protein